MEGDLIAQTTKVGSEGMPEMDNGKLNYLPVLAILAKPIAMLKQQILRRGMTPQIYLALLLQV
jgi:hypothetical protein